MGLSPNPDDLEVPTKAPRGRAAERILAAEQLEVMRALRLTMTEWAAKLAGNTVNNTLAVQTRTFPAEGILPLTYHVAAGAIRVTNLGVAANLVTVHGAPNQGYAPTEGVGVYVVPGGTRETIPMDSHTITLYGTPGDRVSFMVFTTAVTAAT